MVTLASRRGMSLIEAVCALVLLHVAAAALLVASLAHFQAVGSNFELLQAQRAAAAVLESHLAGARPCQIGQRELPEDTPAELPEAHLQEEIQELEPGLFRVQVQISWQSAGRPQSLQLVTLLAREESE